jgi:hypothetical protein
VLQPCGEAFPDDFLGCGEMREHHVVSGELVPVGPLERGTRDDPGHAGRGVFLNPGGDLLQPGPAVLIGQWCSGGHLRDVRGGMKVVALCEVPAQLCGENECNGRLSGTGNTHDDKDRLMPSSGRIVAHVF